MGRPRKDGTRIDNTARRQSVLMDYLRQEAHDGHDWFGFSANAYALDRGECHGTIRTDIMKLADEGKIEFTSKPGSGFFIRIPEPKEPEPQPVIVRKCAKCGSDAPNPEARFCWKCGASLLSDRELLKEAFDRVFPKIAKLSTDSAEMNEIMTVIGKVGKLAFDYVEVSA